MPSRGKEEKGAATNSCNLQYLLNLHVAYIISYREDNNL